MTRCPAQLRHTYDLADLTAALQQIHFPDSQEQLAIARRRLAFEELFYIHLGVVQRRRSLRQLVAPALTTDEALLAQFTAILPFGLTGAQERVIGEIWRDLARSVPMTRMVQGDVGSGKTAVAAAAMWAAVSSGVQCAMLAPTQILAEQHHRGIGHLLGQLTRPDGTPLNVQLLTGRVTGEAREAVLTGLSEGAVDVVVGTTALIQEGVEFANLGLVVVDEQHRFGVEQRGVLRSQAASATAPAGHERHPHPAQPGVDPLRRPGSQHHRRDAARTHAHQDQALCATGAGAPLQLHPPRGCGRAARPTSSTRWWKRAKTWTPAPPQRSTSACRKRSSPS